MVGASNNFIQLSSNEILPKLKLLSERKEIIKIWLKGEDSQIYRVSDVQSLKVAGEPLVLLSLFSEGEEADNQVIDKEVFLNFTLNEMDYFSEGEISVDEADSNLILRLDEDVYRSEKRTNERLLTFPHHQVYSYFKIIHEDATGSNIIPLNREEDEAYLNFKEKQKVELKEKLSQKISDVEDLIGFRALDISRSGIAFLVGQKENSFFDSTNDYPFSILFDGEVFKIPVAKLVYKVDFLNKSKEGARYKVGLNFNPNENLTKKIIEVLQDNSSLSTANKEFEDFVDED